MKLIGVIAATSSTDTVAAIGEQHGAQDFRLGVQDETGRQIMRTLAGDDKVQVILDALHSALGVQAEARIHLLPIEVVLPKPEDADRKKEGAAVAARDELYDLVEKVHAWIPTT